MKKKKLGIMVVVFVAAVVLIAVVSGVHKGIKWYNTDDTVIKDTNKDLLVGVFMTLQPVEKVEELDDTEHYATLVENKLTSEDGEEYTEYTYVFEDLEGYSFFSFYYDDGEKNFWSSVCDEVFSSPEMQLGSERILTSTVVHSMYDTAVTFNPVYQKDDGRIYTILTHSGVVHGIGNPGFSVSEKLSDKAVRFKDGEFQKITTYIDVTLNGRTAVPETIEIQEMKDEGGCIDTETYTPEEIPDVMWPSEETDYVLIRTVYDDGEHGKYSERQVVGREESSFSTFSLDKNRVCKEKHTFIEW